jgi:hypothetical protein
MTPGLLETLSYIATKLSAGVYLMATAEGSLRQRISAASVEFGPAMHNPGAGIPEELDRELRQLHARLWGASGVKATLEALSDTDVPSIAQAIVDASFYANEERLDAECELARPRLAPASPYAFEKLSKAVEGMAVNAMPLRERLRNAYLSFHMLTPDDMPAEARSAFRGLLVRMNWNEAKGDGGTNAATLTLVSDSEIRRLAELVCNAHDAAALVVTIKGGK